MARLIDADALLANQPEGCYRTSDWINAAPTVDAIPVEWLVKKARSPTTGFDPFVYVLFKWRKEQVEA